MARRPAPRSITVNAWDMSIGRVNVTVEYRLRVYSVHARHKGRFLAQWPLETIDTHRFDPERLIHWAAHIRTREAGLRLSLQRMLSLVDAIQWPDVQGSGGRPPSSDT